MTTEYITVGILAFINLFAFVFMGYDKRISVRSDETKRVPEGILFFIATVFGSIGVYVGMLTFRHKTRKWYFQVGLPLLILQNIATLYLAKEMLVKYGAVYY